ncbi:MAG: Ig-like domain-containing protein [Eubacterium sp.]|nr:Ig-like domain-containing protein [Eubacterium sp.]
MKNIKAALLLLIAVLVVGFASLQVVKADQENETTTQNTDNSSIKTIDKVKVKLQADKKKSTKVYSNQKVVFVLRCPKDLKDKKIKYSSSKKSVVKINKKGKIKKLKKGKATVNIKMTAKRGSKKVEYNYKCKLKVKTGVKDINITSPSNKYLVDNKYDLDANVIPQKNDEKIKWDSSDDQIVSVNQKGRIRVIRGGTVTVTAYSSKTKTKSEIIINAPQNPGVYFEEGVKEVIEYGETIQLHPYFTKIAQEALTYTSMDKSMATVTNNGVVKFIRPGRCYIKAKTKSGKWIAVIEVVAGYDKGFLTNAKLKKAGIDSCNKLIIVAHPDDESLWGGAHLKEGKWFIVCMTNNYTAVRKKEFNNMLKLAGAKGIMLDYPDLYTKYVDEKSYKRVKDNWKYFYESAYLDIRGVVAYKKWDLIATHSPTGETSHTHHKQIDKATTQSCLALRKFDKLWYFGKFYKPGEVPEGLTRLDDESIAFKEKLIYTFECQKTYIDEYWKQMIPYENWEKATEYKYKVKKQ